MDRSVPDVRSYVVGILRRRWPGLEPLHDDLASQTIADLVASYRVNDGIGQTPETQAKRQAAVILKRRIADHFRRPVVEYTTAEVPDSAVDAPEGEATVQYRKALRSVIRLLDEVSEEDRELLLGGNVQVSLSARERKRKERLRSRLRRELESELGSSLDDLFGKVP